MSKKRKKYTADLKSKLVLEVLECEQTLKRKASKYDILPKKPKRLEKTILRGKPIGLSRA